MFYDLEDPKSFVSDIEKCLADEGIWHFEQSYMPSMLRTNSYDTICHEHLEFYSLKVVKNLLEGEGLRIIDVQMNDINGGSFAVTACKKGAFYKSNTPIINWLLNHEQEMGLDTIKPYEEFAKRIDIDATPSFLIFNENEMYRIIGAQSFEKFEQVLQKFG